MGRIIVFLCFVAISLSADPKRFLVYGGKTGWIGQKIMQLLQEQNEIVHLAESRLENREDVEREIETVRPDCIINAAGLTGRPNVDWCEDHQIETIRSNILGAINLFDAAYLQKIHVTHFGTGCIYQYDEDHPLGSGIGFKEEDAPNFSGSFYSQTKGMLLSLTRCYPNVLNLRLRMPISSDLHPRSFVTKIIGYEKVIDVPNSVTILDDLLPVAVEMAKRGLVGDYNFTNPGVISHNEILRLYAEYIDPAFTWKNFTIDEQNKILKSKRSNNELDVSKLLKEFPDIPPVHESIRKIFEKIKASQT